MRILDVYEQHASYSPGEIAVSDLERSYTWSELYVRAGRWASALREQGLGYRDSVTVVAGNSADLLALFVGAAGVGVAVAPLNPILRATEMANLMELSRSSVVIAEADRVAVIREAAEMLDADVHVAVFDEIAAGVDALEVTYDDRVNGEEPFSIYFTSGTTGKPKGVYRTQNNTMMDGLVMGLTMGMRPSDDLYLFLPLFHMGGYHSAQLALLVGGSVSIRRGFDAGDLDRSLHEGVTVVMGVPAVWTDFLRQPHAPFPSLRVAYVAGSTAPVALLDQLAVVFPNAGVLHAYGLTECGFVTALRPEDSLAHRGSIGRPLPGINVAVHDSDGTVVATGQPGELVIRGGPAVMEGYLNDPDATAATFRGPWLRTGDLGYVDETGYLYIVGRIKEIIISKGENIAPAEIESVLVGHPAVADCAVLGMPHPEFEEMVVAAVQVVDGTNPSPDELMDYVGERVARFKRPRRIFFVDGFPRTSLGKIAKPELAARLFAAEGAGIESRT